MGGSDTTVRANAGEEADVRIKGMCVVALAALVLGSCGYPSHHPRPRHVEPSRTPAAGVPTSRAVVPGTALVVGSGAAVSVIDPSTRSVLFRGRGVLPATDPSRLVDAVPSGRDTMLVTRRTATGVTIASTTVHGRLGIRVVSGDGSLVALMPPLPAGADPWVPTPRSSTEIVVADPTGGRPAQRFRVQGNVEPEAFSSDGTGLFLIRYLPATAPVAYRVARLELEDGDVYPVFGRRKTWAERMSGTRLAQVASHNGAGLYTLYTSQPPSYAAGFDARQAAARHPVAFVHSLNLHAGFAVCVGLPRSLWGGRPADEAIAVSPEGSRVYVVDTRRGVISVMDTRRLKVVRTARVRLGLGARTATRAAVSVDGTRLFVARGSGLVAVDTSTLRPTGGRIVPGDVTAMGFSPDGRSMYLAVPGEVAVVDAATGASRGVIRTPGLGPATFVGSIAA